MIKNRRLVLRLIIMMGILLAGTLIISGCTEKEEAKMATAGSTVKVHYTGKLDDGTVFDSSEGRDPLEFTLGEGWVIPGFEDAVMGMKTGDSKTVTIPVDEAYGQYHDEWVLVVERDQFPPDLELEVGQPLPMPQGDGQIVTVTVTDISESTVTLDANHPLAGKDLTFTIELMEVN